MKQPFFCGKKLTGISDSGNCGLYYNKFFNQWAPCFKKIMEPEKDFFGGKMNWILAQGYENRPDNVSDNVPDNVPDNNLDAVGQREVGDANQIGESAVRISKLVEFLGGKGPLHFKTTSPFVTGIGLSHPIENGFLWHQTLGVPYLPGSSIKGLIRAWAETWLEEDAESVFRLFGRDDEGPKTQAAGNIIVFDALPAAPVPLMAEVITPHDGGWRIKGKEAPSDWLSPTPIPFLAVAPGAVFQFAFAQRSNEESCDLDLACDYLREALDWIGAGAKTSVGFGRFRPVRPKPFKVGDKVRIKDGHSTEALRKKTGTIEKFYGEGETVELSLDGKTGRGSHPTSSIEFIERI